MKTLDTGFESRARPLGYRIWLALILMMLPVGISAAEVRNTTVVKKAGRFIMHAESFVRIPPDEVRKTLMDFERLPKINPALKQVKVLARAADGGIRMAVLSEFCVLAICLDFSWVQVLRTHPNGDISIAIMADGGDFREGKGAWQLVAENAGTRLTFDVDLTPGFWIPPALGPWLMERKLAEETLETARGMERLAAPKTRK